MRVDISGWSLVEFRWQDSQEVVDRGNVSFLAGPQLGGRGGHIHWYVPRLERGWCSRLVEDGGR